MSLLHWIRALFTSRPPAAPAAALVPYYDTESQRVVRIPAAELRPGCVQARVDGVDEIVWISADTLTEGPLRHPPIDDPQLLAAIGEIQATFAEHRDLSVEQWEEGFRRDLNMVREIAGFAYAADVYRRFVDAGSSAEWRADVYRLIIACMVSSEESVWHVVELKTLQRPEAERIVRRFFHGESADDVHA